MNRSEQERIQVDEQLQDISDTSLQAANEAKRKELLSEYPKHESIFVKPDYEGNTVNEYEVGMWEVRLIPMDDKKEVLVKTEGLSSCIAVVGFFVTTTNERFCLFSHFPFHFGYEFDRELNDPRIMNSIKREFVAILPTHWDNTREIKVLEHILDKHNLHDHSIEWLYRTNTADPKKERKNTVVEMRWKPGEEPVVSYLNESLNWENKTIVFTDKTRPKSNMPPNRIPL